MRVLIGQLPCTFSSDRPHPVASIEGRRLARFRRSLEGGIRFARKRGLSVRFVTLAMRYDPLTGELKGDLRYCTQRFIQKLRRKRIDLEYARVTEETKVGVRNHAHLVIASRGELPADHDLKDLWASSTYGSSFEVRSVTVKDVGVISRYMAKALGSYMSKSFPAEGGLDSSYQNATGKTRVTAYATFSRGWLPKGATNEWKRLFRENAFFWLCDRGFYHTNLGDTSVKWFAWIDRQAWREHASV